MNSGANNAGWYWNNLTAQQQEYARQAFDTAYYNSRNPDLDEKDPFDHYIGKGWRQGRNPSASFNTLRYLLDNPFLIGSSTHPFLHHLFNATGEPLTPASAVSTLQAEDFDQSDIGASSHEPPAAEPQRLAVGPGSAEEEQAFQGLSDHDVGRLRHAFDRDFYLSEYYDIKISDLDPFVHYMTAGWREGRNPSRLFSTNFYLKSNADIAGGGGNPFTHWVLHGARELRAGISFSQKMSNTHVDLKVAAIVPNYNHAKFLPRRLDSILSQTYPHISVTVLDDCSTDNSREVIEDYVARHPGRIRAIFNDTNSGGVFRQWRKGVTETDGELVWICESDDFCEHDFVETLVRNFADDSVQIAFGRILETDMDGVPDFRLDTYREEAEPGIWNERLVRPAARWFANGFGVSNVIANVGGCMFRRSPLPDAVWEEAATYSVVGDWYLYLQVASGGQIAWEPDAISYFRRHGANTSSNSFHGAAFYKELERLMIAMRHAWAVPESTVLKFYTNVSNMYNWIGVEKAHGPLKLHCDLDKIMAVNRERPHLLIAMLGFVPGGGENFPIQLANALVDAGWLVSMVTFESTEMNEHMRKALNPRVSVYEAAWVGEYGCDRFVRDAGVSLIHSHNIISEMYFNDQWLVDPDLPYVATLHGSYECCDLTTEKCIQLTSTIDHFVYTADKNLLPFEALQMPSSKFTKMANAMPIDPMPFPQTREEMGIAADAIIFTLVARGIQRKGWRAAIEAFGVIRAHHPGRPMHLCLVGEGDETDKQAKAYSMDPDISFLGYQSRIHGLYRMSDVAIVPSRFAGESYPLCIIQAMQVGTPIVASNVGEIPKMLVDSHGVRGGLLVEADRDTETFIRSFASAMEEMLDDDLRFALGHGALELSQKYDMGTLVEQYGEVYSKVLNYSS